MQCIDASGDSRGKNTTREGEVVQAAGWLGQHWEEGARIGRIWGILMT
jgi:hypothetical protein